MAGDPSTFSVNPNGADVYNLQGSYTAQPSIQLNSTTSYPVSYAELPNPNLFTYSGIAFSFQKEGYDFVEWNTSADGTGTSKQIGEFESQGGHNNITYYAIWQATSSGGSGGSGGNDISVTYGGEEIAQLSGSGTITMPTADKLMSTDVVISASGSGGGGGNPEAEPNDVEFIDYDGAIRYSYTAAEFANLTALPPNPTHEGLTAQGWNWTLADAKTYVASYGGLVIGQMYITDDGKTRIYISLNADGLSPYLGLCPNGTATIEWGDGSTSSVTGSSLTTIKNTQHTYASAGDYVIKITPPSGSGEKMRFPVGYGGAGSNSTQKILWTTNNGTINQKYAYSVRKIELGAGITNIPNYCFIFMRYAYVVNLPHGITTIGQSPEMWGNTSHTLILPDTVTSITKLFFTMGSTSGLNMVKKISIPNSITALTAQVFQGYDINRAPNKVYVPSSVTTIENSCFYGCGFEKLVLPSSIISTAFRTNPIASLYNGALIQKYTIPNNATQIPSWCFSQTLLAEIDIPSTVTSIDTYAFASCACLVRVTFHSTTPPTLSASNVFNSLPTDCKIYVPSSALSTYKSATNYPSSSTYTYVGY